MEPYGGWLAPVRTCFAVIQYSRWSTSIEKTEPRPYRDSIMVIRDKMLLVGIDCANAAEDNIQTANVMYALHALTVYPPFLNVGAAVYCTRICLARASLLPDHEMETSARIPRHFIVFVRRVCFCPRRD